MRKRAPQLGSGQAMSASVVIQSAAAGGRRFAQSRPVLARNQRKQRGHGIEGKSAAFGEDQIFTFDFESLAEMMTADEIAALHGNGKVKEFKLIRFEF